MRRGARRPYGLLALAGLLAAPGQARAAPPESTVERGTDPTPSEGQRELPEQGDAAAPAEIPARELATAHDRVAPVARDSEDPVTAEASVQLRTAIHACADALQGDGSGGSPATACDPVVAFMQDVAVAIESNKPGPLAEATCLGQVDAAAVCSLREQIAEDARCLVSLIEDGQCVSGGGKGRDLPAASESIIHGLNAYYAYTAGNVSLVLRGGLSLGNYQAGVIYYITEHMKARHEEREKLEKRYPGSSVPARGFSTVTGASAGGINTFIAALEPWRNRQLVPEETDYYEGWTGVGLFGRHGQPGFVTDSNHSVSPLGLLSKEPLRMAAKRVAEQARDGVDLAGATGATGMGITVTRLEAIDAPVHYIVDAPGDQHDGSSADPLGHVALTTKKQSERLLFELSSSPGPSGGGAVEVGGLRPFVSAAEMSQESVTYGHARSLYPLLGSGYSTAGDVDSASYQFEQLVPVLQATSAFPLAFAPTPLELTPVGHGGRPQPAETRDFVDGGIFDNTPLGLAVEMDDWGQRRRVEVSATTPCRVHPGASRLFEDIMCDYLHQGQYTYVFVEPTVTDWTPGGTDSAEPPKVTTAGEEDDRALLGTELDFLATFAGTSNGAALLQTSEDQPFVIENGSWLQRRRRLVIPERRMSITATQLANFMAFFEKDFRIFDFYVGVMDAQHFAERDPIFGMLGKAPEIDSTRYTCMHDYYTSVRATATREISARDLPASCSTDRLMVAENVALLSKVSKIKRLERSAIRRMDEDWNQSEPDPEARALLFAAEDRISSRNFRRLLIALHNYRVWSLGKHYDEKREFERFFEELDVAGYKFVDMQRGRRLESLSLTAKQARVLIRDLMQRGVNQLSRAQPDRAQRIAVSMLGTLGADFYEPRPSLWQYSLGLNFNGLETSAGFYLGHERRVRWDVAGARLYRIRNELYALHLDAGGDNIKRTSASGLVYSRLSVIALRKAVLGLEIGVGFFADWMFTFMPRPGEGSAMARNFVGLRYGPELSMTAVLLRHIYVDLQLGVYADDCANQDRAERCQVEPAYFPEDGRRANNVLTAPVRFSAGLGWRWTF
jgi:predicted acylesterase/phospholipase RssA